MRVHQMNQNLQTDDLTYSVAEKGTPKSWLMRQVENFSGRHRLMPIYRQWQAAAAQDSSRMMQDLLERIETRIDLTAPQWPLQVPEGTPLVMIANHPFGIGDGIALLSLAEQLGRPYRVLINREFLRVPEIRPHSLPIDFSETREALELNLKTRMEARKLLQQGVTIVVFPAGGVATAERLFGKAEELPWKTFTARLVQQARASVLPVFFEGQNSALFHFVSRYSHSLRLSLLIAEFRRSVRATMKVHAGGIMPFEALGETMDRRRLTEELYLAVHRLAPGAADLPREALLPRPVDVRRQYPWDKPLQRPRTAPETGAVQEQPAG